MKPPLTRPSVADGLPVAVSDEPNLNNSVPSPSGPGEQRGAGRRERESAGRGSARSRHDAEANKACRASKSISAFRGNGERVETENLPRARPASAGGGNGPIHSRVREPRGMGRRGRRSVRTSLSPGVSGGVRPAPRLGHTSQPGTVPARRAYAQGISAGAG